MQYTYQKNLMKHLNYSDLWKIIICDALRDLVPLVQFEKREKHSLRSVTFSKVAGNCTEKPVTLLKIPLVNRCFSRFLNCTKGSKSRKDSHLKVKA